MCDYDDEGSDVWNEKRRKARREHRCYACQETIRVGDIYQHTTSLYEGSWDTWRHCLRCVAMLDALAARDLHGTMAIALGLDCGEVWDDPPPEVAALAFLTKAEIQALKVSPPR